MATLGIEAALYYKLANTTALTALVGSRIHPAVDLPNSPEYPLITYQKISNPIMQNSGNRTSGECPRFQISIYAKDYDSVLAIRTQVLTTLENSTGHWGNTDYLNIQWCYFDGESDLYDEAMKVCGRELDFIIWHD